jgi:hypothetical protein
MDLTHGITQLAFRRFRSAGDFSNPASQRYPLGIVPRIRGAALQPVGFMFPQCR